MTNPGKKKQQTALSETGVLRSLLSVANDDDHGASHEPESHVLILGRSRATRKWDLRWLKQSGFELTIEDDAAKARRQVELLQPSLVIVEAAMLDADKNPVYRTLLRDEESDPPVVVLTNSASETCDALDHGAHDVVRKPLDWRLISHRAEQTIRLGMQQKELGSARESLRSAVDLVDRMQRHRRDTDSFEPVTGLPNRGKFQELLLRSAPSVRSSDNLLVVMVISLNRFNLIAESLGVTQTNSIASSVASLLRDCLQTLADNFRLERGLRTASVARIAPDRFAIMTSTSSGPEEITALRQSVLEKLGEAMLCDGQSLYLSPCVGAAVYPRDVSDATHLLFKAESAMRDGRERGAQFCHHSPSVDAQIARRIEIETRLHAAISKKELTLAYQPLVDLNSNRIVGCEALLRWPQSDGSSVSPGEFVPIAESSGLMIQIGEFVLRTACKQLADWARKGERPIRMSVNVSKCQLLSDQFSSLVEQCIKDYGIDPAMLDLELSERGALKSADDIVSRLRSLKALGVSLSIDDFGTGEAAISYLKDLPVDVLKIDRSYIMALNSSEAETAITSAMVALGQRLNLTVIAEGVESNEQLEMVRRMGCDQYQGFFRSPAVAPEAFVSMLKDAD